MLIPSRPNIDSHVKPPSPPPPRTRLQRPLQRLASSIATTSEVVVIVVGSALAEPAGRNSITLARVGRGAPATICKFMLKLN